MRRQEMATTPRDKYESERNAIERAAGLTDEAGPQSRDVGEIPEVDAKRILDFLSALDPEDLTAQWIVDGKAETRSNNTLYQYGRNLRTLSYRADKPLVDLRQVEQQRGEDTPNEVNVLMQSFADGSHPDVKDAGLSNNTLVTFQTAIRKFYEYHDDLGVDANAVTYSKQDRTPVDKEDMYTKEEIQAMRDNVGDSKRDKAVLELFINTGQRVTAIQTLRLKDVYPDEGRYRLNPEADGRKRAEGKRPLLAARKAVREWVQAHPAKDDPEAFLITHRRSVPNADPGDMVSDDTIRKILRDIVDCAGVDKPANPHNFRHNFVTMCKEKYGMNDDTIKFLIGHDTESTVMETTYAHVGDDHHIKHAEESMGIREESKESPLTPDVCETCGEPLGPSAKACEACGEVYTPDAVAAKRDLEQWEFEHARQTEPGSEEDEAVKQFREFREDNPDVAEQVLDAVNEALGNGDE